ncbi:hypothetical protein SO3561_10342 [Streptomyces olivochromogenes]|uniref:Uncharacterized protein n=1 Tax=Streptomyces olivochromogenes TaxID=1963 RepID=A0A286PGT8_STROL|nr:hypothetical protein SO3561_10342 [Streptomyces olivochromogenes]
MAGLRGEAIARGSERAGTDARGILVIERVPDEAQDFKGPPPGAQPDEVAGTGAGGGQAGDTEDRDRTVEPAGEIVDVSFTQVLLLGVGGNGRSCGPHLQGALPSRTRSHTTAPLQKS